MLDAGRKITVKEKTSFCVCSSSKNEAEEHPEHEKENRCTYLNLVVL